jgi:serine/threonine protein kinase
MAFRTVRNWIRGTDNSNPQPNVSRHGLATLPADSVSIVNRQDNKLGEGSYAKVYGAFHNGKERALKVFKEDLITTEKAVEEFKRLNSLKHPNIVRVYGLWVDPHKGRNALAIVMEICDSSLKKFIKERFDRGISREKKLQILHNIASAMIYLHGQNIIHGDLRTPNVLVIEKGDLIIAKLTDFGMARVLDSKSQAHVTTTTIDEDYLPPEVFSHQEYKDKKKNWAKLTKSVDVFCFGPIAIELGCGEFPKPTAKVETKKGVVVKSFSEVERREKYLMKIKPALRTCTDLIIEQCLAERPEERGSFLDLQIIIQSFQTKYAKRPDKELLEEKQLECEELRSKMEADQITLYNESQLQEAMEESTVLKDTIKELRKEVIGCRNMLEQKEVEIKQKESEHAKMQGQLEKDQTIVREELSKVKNECKLVKTELDGKVDDWSTLQNQYQKVMRQYGDLTEEHVKMKEDGRKNKVRYCFQMEADMLGFHTTHKY